MILKNAREVIEREAEAIRDLASKLDENFTAAVRLILECQGRVIVTGMGKSGLVGKKVAATFSSTGISAFFLHPAEGVHGDIGLVRSDDILIAISKSGATEELHQILPAVKRLGVKIILLTGQVDSPLASRCDLVLDCSVAAEACPNNLVPTSSTTAAMVMGDALAVALLKERNFSAEDFAYLHPGGSLGRRLLMHVEELMHVNSEIPIVKPETNMRDTILEITGKRLGAALVVDDNNVLVGIFTDGDLRRLAQEDDEFFSRTTGEVMIKNPKSIRPGAILDEALAKMEKFSITVLPVVNEKNQPVGIIHLHDILKSKLV
ncbi:MAG: KpsF/GutQ family sugar-phosphate isomerase [Candidatus Zixiibacteriota bacterium]|nr:MAG: KpsF/GutQ family sugar-phosphate isomerase [candidate division Zixibacteria bacterium]